MERVRVSGQYFTLHYNPWVLFGSRSISCFPAPQFQLCAASDQKANVIIALEMPAFPDHIKIIGRMMIAHNKNLSKHIYLIYNIHFGFKRKKQLFFFLFKLC